MTKKQKREKVLKELQELWGNGDFEFAHSKADDLLIELIDDEEIKRAYDGISKWYA